MDSFKKKVMIIGAGPAGLFAALKLANDSNFEISIFDKGQDLDGRLKKRNSVCGLGGAGLFSDGKLIFSPYIGNNLLEVISERELISLIQEVEKKFSHYSQIYYQEDEKIIEKRLELEKKAIQVGVKFLPSRLIHLGSDNLPFIIDKIKKDLESSRVNFYFEKLVEKIKDHKIYVDGQAFDFDYLILAPGRSGALWLEKIVKDLGIEYKYNPLDIGVRVETLAKVMEEVCQIDYDPKFYIQTPTYEDMIRTFCVSPYGQVVCEDHGDFVLVNGHSHRNSKTENTNFAFLVKIRLTEPLENTNLYGETIAHEMTVVGGGKPILQRFGDLKRGRRSTWSRLEKSTVAPTLTEVTPGDISMAMPYRFVKNILEGLEILDKLIPGIGGDNTLLYAPEIKFHGLRVLANKFLETNLKNIFVAGDGAGLSRGIVGAAVSGLLAAEGIMRKK